MKMSDIPFGTTDWSSIVPVRYPGEAGHALWRTQEFSNIRVRLVEYSRDYRADHWCSKGHILFVLEGELVTELEGGRSSILKAGQSFQVADGAEPHLIRSTDGAKVFIVD